MYEPVLSPHTVQELLQENPAARLLDVRTPGEFEGAHIQGAYNVPLDQLSAHRNEIRKLTAPVVLVCQSGNRARQAEATLRQAGMENLHLLEGGIQRWQAEGHAVQRGQTRISMERQVRIAAGLLVVSGSVLARFVHPSFLVVPVLVGTGLTFSGLTDTCGMAKMLSRLPYNQVSCDINQVVCSLTQSR